MISVIFVQLLVSIIICVEQLHGNFLIMFAFESVFMSCQVCLTLLFLMLNLLSQIIAWFSERMISAETLRRNDVMQRKYHNEVWVTAGIFSYMIIITAGLIIIFVNRLSLLLLTNEMESLSIASIVATTKDFFRFIFGFINI